MRSKFERGLLCNMLKRKFYVKYEVASAFLVVFCCVCGIPDQKDRSIRVKNTAFYSYRNTIFLLFSLRVRADHKVDRSIFTFLLVPI